LEGGLVGAGDVQAGEEPGDVQAGEKPGDQQEADQ
jgi:hypothetical protein